VKWQSGKFVWPGLALGMVIVTVVWLRTTSLHRVKSHAAQQISDLGRTAPLNQPGGGPVSDEAYAVYSALYQAPMGEPLVFAEDSLTDVPQVNGNCLRPATPEEHEMADAFVAANQQSHRWEEKFSIPQGYRLLSPDESRQAQTCLENHQRPGAACGNYQQLRYVRFLGVPGFDHEHRHALVSVIKSCGHLCGSGGIFAVEKTGAQWQRSLTTDFTRDCSWMY
jgi:hypothetical protein